MKTELSEKKRRDLINALIDEMKKFKIPDGMFDVEFVIGDCEKFSVYKVFILKFTEEVSKCLSAHSDLQPTNPE